MSVILRYACFKQSDWLLKHFQPIMSWYHKQISALRNHATMWFATTNQSAYFNVSNYATLKFAYAISSYARSYL